MADGGMLPSSTRPANFRYGNVDQNQLLSRLVSHPLRSAQDGNNTSPQPPGGSHYRAYSNKQPPVEHKFEPLPVLKRYQKHNDPKEIQARNRQQLIEANKLRVSSPELPADKRAKLSLPPIHSRTNENGKTVHDDQDDWASITSSKRRQLDSRETLHGEKNMFKVFDFIRQAPDGFFLYLAHAYSRNDTRHSYYNLKVVSYEQCGREYFTISNSGVSYYRPGEEVEFTPLDTFAKEYDRYVRLIKIKTFATFRTWKAFMVWYKNIRVKKVTQSSKALTDNLFLLQDALRPALLNIREMCFRISDMSLCKIEKRHTYTLQEFTDSQNNTLKQVAQRLQEFRDLVKDVVASACRTRLFEAGFVPDDFIHGNEAGNEHTSGGGAFSMPDSMDIDTLAQPPDKATYAEQANKRNHCRRLTNFIRLCDYLIVNTFHVLAVNSVQSLKNHFLEQLEATPSKDEIVNYVEEIKRKVDKATAAEGAEEPPPPTETKPPQQPPGPPGPGHRGPGEEEPAAAVVKQHIPLFVTEMRLLMEAILYHPDLASFQTHVNSVIANFQTTLLDIDNLIPDTTFDNFTRPIINNKPEEKTCGDGPDLRSMFTADYHFQDLIKDCNDSLEAGFNAAKIYSDTFEEFHRFYVENENTDVEALKSSSLGVEFFAEALARYTREEKIAQLIDVKKPLGLLMIDATDTKAKLEPSPRRILDVINEILPKIAKAKTDALKSEAQDATVKLETKPESTLDFVDALTFLDEIQERIDPLEQEAEIVRLMYELIEQYKVPCPPEDIVSYSSLTTTLNGCRNAMDKALTERDAYITKFVALLDKDIELLTQEVRQIKQDSQNPLLLDPTADKDKVKLLLDDHLKKIDTKQKTSTQYRMYQKNFKVEVTKFDELEEVYGELKLKELLWNSLAEWDVMLEEAKTTDFNKLDHEALTGTVNKYGKNVYQLERGLPPNQLVPILKDKVESLRSKLPTITNLRNPNLRRRHWDVIEDLIKFHPTPEDPLTLGKLIDINAFQHEERIQEISGQASSEASLEGILKRVEESWKSVEFPVIPYKDYKDVYILGGTDDIIQLLDDANINIATIASSRHVGPIKPRVEEWQANLDLFGKTLDAWSKCQKTWQYLESIFGAPDIQRQLPAEAKMFNQVDKTFKDVMRKTNKIPLAIKAGTQPGYLELFQTNNALLDQIQHALASYLETKRSNFPRFYFLSDEELLEILSQTRNPLAVQPHLRKCFEGINRLEFAAKGGEDMEMTVTMAPEIRAMLSPEGERVEVLKVKATGNVEDWLKQVEKNMITAVRACIKKAKDDFEKSIREEWLVRHPHQSVLTVSQTYWCLALTRILSTEEDRQKNLQEFEQKSYQDLNKLAALVRQELPQLVRDVCRALITIDVHARDIVSEMVQIKDPSEKSFEWLKQLRYYFENDLTVIRMANAQYIYGYEYLGASDRLVITPLTDRCYLCLMGALQLDLGGAPAGPAGTGKTETTKDLAKALAKQCVVFNCSDQVDYKMMGRFFSGLAQSGAWACFDEFNRINIEVLSVIAQQLITIRDAKAAKLSTFMFEGREIRLVPSCAVFITMNPGYAGRTELPDNLKALFRPQSMMVPDYRLIAEVILYSEGFENSKVLARKMVQMYKLCSEQLSQQDHYDFGMRAVKSVLVMAGVLKRESPNIDEDLVLIRALRDSNLPKFLTDDAILFKAIIQDLFPNVVLPEHDYGQLRSTIIEIQERRGLQTDESQLRKVIQFYETMLIRHGVMLVGPTLGGKTTVYRILADALTDLHKNGVAYHFYQPVHTYVLNPKSITAGELYGEFNKTTMEWKDGLMGSSVRQCVQDQSKDHHWIICDGPVDAVWIENLNTVLDDNKMLCLANSERIKYTPYMHMVFEVQDLASASPATVSRCGMVYIDSNDIRWYPYVKTWSRKFEEKFGPLYTEHLMSLFNNYVDKGLTFVRKNCKEVIKQVDIAKVITICCLIDALLTSDPKIDLKLEESKIKIMISTTFAFCYVWGAGGNINSKDWDQFDTFVRQQFDEDADAKLGQGGDLFSYEVDVHHRRMETWEKSVPTFKYDKTKPFFDLLVPNIDSCRFGYLLEKLVSVNKSVLFTGETGVGKTVIARAQLLKLADEQNLLPLFLNFSAQTSSKRTQEMIVPKLEKRKKGALGPPRGKRMAILIDDLNMPKLETYGAQPPIELLRQYQDFGGLYDRETLKWIEIQDVILCAACGPPGGGRNPTTARLLRHFAIFAIPPPSEYSLKHIFKSILNGYLTEFNQNTRTAGDGIVDAAVEIYSRMSAELLPTPTKSHYVFNLRDLSKCIQGILQVKPESVSDRDGLARVFFHEAMRVFHDRLINEEDKQYFHTMLSELASRLFAIQIEPTTFAQKPIIFGDFMKVGAPKNERLYEEITDMNKIRNILQDYQEDYNLTNNKNTRLVFFMDAIEHIARIARIIRQDRGNALLVGVGGTGKQSLTRLASHICGYKCFQIELSRGYNYDSFHEDLKKLYEQAGPNNQNTVFLFTDNQIVVEEFLEDINNILNSGEVPNLFDKQDEYERMIIGCRPGAKDAGIAENDRDGIYTFFINRVRNNLHLVLCMSPVGSAFRTRCRMFPSLVNCCTLDWFSEWPREALLSVAHTFFEKYPWQKGEEFMTQALAKMCVEIHMSVTEKAKRLLSELRRYYYTTPTSYLELINLYLMMLNDKKKEIDNARARVERGLKKLEETNVLVDEMQKELVALEPQLKKKSDETAKLMEALAIDQEKADEVRRVVMEDEAVARVKAEETQAMKDDAQRDLNQALPAVEKANEAIGRLKKESIGEVRTFTKPPHMVEVVMQAVCIMFEKKKDWPSAKLLLGDSDLINQIRNYPKDNIPESVLRDIRPYLQMPNFNYKDVLQSSVACASLAEWVIAMDMYAKISKEVEPKRKRVAAAEADLKAVTEQLKKKQQQLQQVEAKIKELQDSYDHQVAEKKKLEISIMQTQSRLKRASKLTTALADEQIRWKENITEFREQMKTVTGNVFVSSACVAYYGAFPSSYRQELVAHWVTGCKEHSIPVSDNPSIINVLADAFSIRQWVTQGLPRDDFSTENAILVTKGRRWPLIIDPQEQANRWIKNKEKENALKVIKMTDGHFLRILENCVRIGMPLLLEDVGETLDPALEPILLKQTFMSGGRLLIRLGDSDIEYDPNFKFYMTTKLSNPHYLPEICIKVTIINFSVTKQGLEDQILSDVVRLERPDLDEEMNRLIVTMNNDRNQLKAIEDKILKMLFESEGNILDNEELVNSLNDSKVTSSAIKRRLEETIKTEANISAAREKYRRVAKRGSLLYFVVADLGLIDPMYQFSLRYFTQLFNATIENSTKSEDLNQRLTIILDATTENIYTNVSRGLFEKDKLVFSFLLCAEILKLEGAIDEAEWNFLLRGGLITDQKRPPKPAHDWLSLDSWNQALALASISETFKNLPRDLEQYPQPIYVQITPDLRIAINPQDQTTKVNSDYNTKLSEFQKLVFVKTFAPYLLVQSITYFVAEQLGKKFVESPSVELPILYQDMSNRTALVFILSTGSDPMSSFTRFAAEMNMSTSYKAISLGQGQGPVAEDMIAKSVVAGEWVFLQNCHLAASWMINMEAIVKNINEGVTPCHNNFRLFLSSMPAKTFPVSVLQNSVKVTSEPPKGIRANMKRAFTDINATFFETHRLEMDWKKIIFGICFFHAILLERKKFGPLGFNIRYEFNDSDRDCALLNFDMFCKEGAIPWDALIYITGEITYGGRVTDFWDQRCLRTILRRFFSPETLESGYKYSPSGVYYCPEQKFLQQYRDYIEDLPLNDNPEIFGMNSNANITFQTQESNYLVNTIIDIQPRVSSGGAGKSNDEIVYELAENILGKLPEKLDIEKAPRSLFEPDAKDRLNSLTTVLQQEVDRYNRLLNIIKLSLTNQMKAIKGLVVMDETLEKMYNAFLNNQVPAIWANAAYPSLKSLASWIKDLLLRCDFMALWLLHGLPKSYWLPGLFFPQGFLTGVLQVHARKYDLPIDELSFHFTILPYERDHESYNEQAKRLEYGKKLEVDEKLPAVKDGVILHGLFMEAFRWDSERQQITDAIRGEMVATLPMLHMEPRQNYVVDPSQYISPLYKTAARAGVLSTTGHSTNFVVTVNLPTDKPQDYWISMGSALLCQISD